MNRHREGIVALFWRCCLAAVMLRFAAVDLAVSELVPEASRGVRGRVVIEPPPIKFARFEHPVAGGGFAGRGDGVRFRAGPICAGGRDGVLTMDAQGSVERHCLLPDSTQGFGSERWGQIPPEYEVIDFAPGLFDRSGRVGVAVLFDHETVASPLFYPPLLAPTDGFPEAPPKGAGPKPKHKFSAVLLLAMEGRGEERTLQLISRGRTPIKKLTRIVAPDLDGDGRSDLIAFNADGTTAEFYLMERGSNDAVPFRSLRVTAHAGLLLVAGYGDADGLGKARMFAARSDLGGELTSLITYGVVQPAELVFTSVWGQLAIPGPWEPVAVGDFNGDGRSDMLVKGTAISGWWMAFGNRHGVAVERSIQGPWAVEEEFGQVLSGDFDGDGVGELLRLAPDKRHFWRYQSDTPRAVEGVVIANDNGATVTSDVSGRFEIPCTDSSCKLTFSKPGYRFGAPELSASSVSDPISREIVVLAQDEAVLARERTKPFRLGIDAEGPYACLAFMPGSDRRWGLTGDRPCPRGYAYVASDDGSGNRPESELVWTNGLCCRLPGDVLRGESEEAATRCRDGWVATGSHNVNDQDVGPKRLICTEINADRYRLGPKVPGSYWGTGQSMRGQDRVRTLAEISASLRMAVQRRSYHGFDVDGCVGDPPGSLLVNKGSGACKTFLFRQLLYRGAPGDPPDGTPVPLVPSCDELENMFDPGSGCRE